MAPDKIYINPMPNPSDGYVGIAWKDAHGKMDEYIRKEALIEWANDNLLECEASNDDADYGRIDAFKKLIDKLGSL